MYLAWTIQNVYHGEVQLLIAHLGDEARDSVDVKVDAETARASAASTLEESL
jgi:hypothetical protein